MHTNTAAVASAALRKPKAPRLVIADDHCMVAEGIERILDDDFDLVEVASDGASLLDAVRRLQPDLVVSDISMPDMSGLDVLKQVRVMQAGQDLTPFIVLSADATATTVRECEQAGARMFLTKPVAVNRLLEALADVALGREAPLKPQQAAAQVTDPAEGQDPIISRAMLEELAELQLSDGFISLFIDECLRDALKTIGELEKSGKTANWDLFRDQCHALKGVASNMGALRLTNAASATMKLANWQMPREWRVRIVMLREQLEAARAALKPEGPARLEGEGDRTP